MQKIIRSALISVYYKDGLEKIISLLDNLKIKIYTTGGTQQFIEDLGICCTPVESVTGYPSILEGRVKTLHPAVFGGILGKRENAIHADEMRQYNIPEIDLVIVDLYPFEETVQHTQDEDLIIEKIDVGGPSMLRAAAKNHRHVTVISSRSDYKILEDILVLDKGETSLELRRSLAIKAFDVCTAYDMAISNYFNNTHFQTPFNKEMKSLRYGENPHQKAVFYGDLNEHFFQLHGKELSYNNLVDIDAAVNLINEFSAVKNDQATNPNYIFAIFKHTNVCGIASAESCSEAWKLAHAGDPESAFGGVLICNGEVDVVTANVINDLFFEVLIAPSFTDEALEKLKSKKNRVLLQLKNISSKQDQSRTLLNGILSQQPDTENYSEWKEEGGRITTTDEKASLIFANIVCKHLKSNAIALVKGNQLIGKGCGQTSRIDALRHAIAKAKQFSFSLDNAVLASDAFFPFDDCVRIAHQAGITAFIQPGGSVRDIETLNYSKENNLAMVLTGMRHFKH